ncbi:MAG: hypothetical protein ABIC40_08365 [bacterium]
MKLRENILAIAVHGGILLIALVLVLTSSCQSKPPPPPEPEPVDVFFKSMLKSLDEAAAESITIIAVDDSIGTGEDLARQVYQDIQSRLHGLGTLTIFEFPSNELKASFDELGVKPSDGIAPEQAVNLAEKLNSSALLYASIESKTPDVYVRIYSGATGSVIFSETLSAWPLSVKREVEIPVLTDTGTETEK